MVSEVLDLDWVSSLKTQQGIVMVSAGEFKKCSKGRGRAPMKEIALNTGRSQNLRWSGIHNMPSLLPPGAVGEMQMPDLQNEASHFASPQDELYQILLLSHP